MKQRVIYTEKQPSVRYKKISSTKADVIINKYIGEEIMITNPLENLKQTMFVYDTNIFSADPAVITEAEVNSKIDFYLNYEEEKEKTLEEKVVTLESENQMLTQCILELSAQVYK